MERNCILKDGASQAEADGKAGKKKKRRDNANAYMKAKPHVVRQPSAAARKAFVGAGPRRTAACQMRCRTKARRPAFETRGAKATGTTIALRARLLSHLSGEQEEAEPEVEPEEELQELPHLPLPNPVLTEACDAAPLIGERLRQKFPAGFFRGRVDRFNEPHYHVTYCDDDGEELSKDDCKELIDDLASSLAIDRPDSCIFTDSEKSKIEVRGVELPEDARDPDPLAHRILQLWVNGKCEIDDCLRFEWRRWDGSICLFDHADEPMPVKEVDQERVRVAVAGLCYWAGFKLEVRT